MRGIVFAVVLGLIACASAGIISPYVGYTGYYSAPVVTSYSSRVVSPYVSSYVSPYVRSYAPYAAPIAYASPYYSPYSYVLKK